MPGSELPPTGIGIRRLPQPFVARLVPYDVHAVVDDGHGPPGKEAAAPCPAAFVGSTLAGPAHRMALSSLNNRSTGAPVHRPPGLAPDGRGGPGAGSGLARQGPATVERDHVGEGGGDVDGVAGTGALALGEGAVQVAGQALGMGERGEATEVGLAGGLEGAEPGRAWPRRRSSGGSGGTPRPTSTTSGPHTSPWPGTITSGSSSIRQSRATSDPATDPMRTKGVPPLNTRSPVNRTRCSGIHATTSLVVCAAVPK